LSNAGLSLFSKQKDLNGILPIQIIIVFPNEQISYTENRMRIKVLINIK